MSHEMIVLYRAVLGALQVNANSFIFHFQNEKKVLLLGRVRQLTRSEGKVVVIFSIEILINVCLDF